MKQEELNEILRKHKLWFEGEEGGERADLRGCDLRGCDLRDADLQGCNLQNCDLQNCDLQYAKLQNCDLQDADLRGTDLDFSCFPLWCGGKNWTVDDKLPKMLCAFICSMNCDDEETKNIQELIRPYAEKSHRAEDIF